jgi:hypothetical protein
MVLSDKFFYIFASLLCLLGIGIFVYNPSDLRDTNIEQIAFFEDVTGNVTSKNVGQINYRSVEPGNSVQSGDYVLTSDQSEALVRFTKSKALLKVASNSLVQIQVDDDKINLAAESGFFDLEMEQAPPITVAGKRIKGITAGGEKTKLQIFRQSKNSQPVLRVVSGMVEVNVDSDETEQEPVKIESGEALLVDTLEKKEVDLRAESPPNFTKILPNQVQDFEWSSENVNLVVFQVAKDIEFEDIVYQKKSFKTGTEWKWPTPGTYYWRIADEKGNTSFTKQIIVLAPAAPKVLKPQEGAQIKYLRGRTLIDFAWASDLEGQFEVELIQVSNKKKTRKRFTKKEVKLKLKHAGLYKWRVRARRKWARWTSFRTFNINFTQGSILALGPNINYSKNLETEGRFKELVFKWGGKVDGGYRFRISNNAEMTWAIVNQQTLKKEFRYVPTKGGRYFWNVESLKYPGVDSVPRPFIIQQSVGEFISPANLGKIDNKNSKNEVEFVVLKNLEESLVLEVSRRKDFKFNLYRVKMTEPRKILNLRPGKYFARLTAPPGRDQDVWLPSKISFRVKKPNRPEAPVMPKYLQAFIMNPDEAIKKQAEKYFVAWPESDKAVKYEIRMKSNTTNKVRVFSSKDANMTLLGSYSDSFDMRVIAIDSWGRRSPASKIAKLLFPIAPLTKFPKYLRNPENWDYENLENIVNQKVENEYEEELD